MDPDGYAELDKQKNVTKRWSPTPAQLKQVFLSSSPTYTDILTNPLLQFQ